MKSPYITLLIYLYFVISLSASPDSTTIPKLMELRPYLDSLIEAERVQQHIPGVTIAIVTDSQHVYYNGFGYANVDEQRKVDAATTGFRIASISKTFIATAALQLVEEGKLDLHADIRQYLPDDDFEFLQGQPITMHQLLTHTAGIDMSDTNDSARDPDKIIPVEELARRHIPKQVHMPGTVHSYSNFGYGLAGYVIQAIVGKPIEAHLKAAIFDPLDMPYTSLAQPPPSPILENEARAYRWEEDQFKILEKEYLNVGPAGAMKTNARDMANYMLMQLNGGTFRGQILLQPESHRMLTSQQYGSKGTHFGICYSFFEGRDRGYRSLYHGGGVEGFISALIMIPEAGMGVFISQNTRYRAGGFSWQIARAVFDTLLTQKVIEVPAPEPPIDFDERASRYEGYYKQVDYPHSNFEKAGRLVGQFSAEFPVKYIGEGILTFRDIPFVEIEENLFQVHKPNNPWTIEFLTDESGKVTGFFNGLITYERIPWYLQAKILEPFLYFLMLVLAIQALSSPLSLLSKRFRLLPPSWYSSWQYWTGTALLTSFLGIMISDMVLDSITDFGVPFSLKVSFFINILAAASTLLAPFALWKLWTAPEPKTWQRIINTLIIAVIVTTAILYWQHNLIGFNY